jgi:hypothetical protein
VQANHHVASRFTANNADLDDVKEDELEFSREGSAARADALARALALGGPAALEEVARVLDAGPCTASAYTHASLIVRYCVT